MIELKKPCDGVCVCLQTPFQKEFIREGRRYLTGELDLQSFRDQALVDTSRPCKVVFVWDAKDSHGFIISATLEISKNEDFSDIFLSSKAQNRYEAYNFEAGRTYYWRVKNPYEESEVRRFTTDGAAPRFLYVDGTTNVRDIGGFVTEDGKRIKQGLLFRGAELDMKNILGDAGRKTMTELLGIKTDIDLRNEVVGYTDCSALGEGVRYEQVSMRAYEEYIIEENFANIVKVFDLLADEKNYPLYFHCRGGADRTGCVAFTIEAILGLDEENLMKNFELTCLSAWGNIKNRDEEDFSNMIKELLTYGENWKERMTKFLLKAGVPQDNIEKIREIMLEKA